MENLNSNKILYFGVILIIGLIISATIVSETMYKMKQLENTLSVTGSAKEKVVSDIVKWNGNFSRTVGIAELKNGYDQMKTDESIVLNFLKDSGIEEKNIIISAVTVEEPYRYDSNAPQQYTLRQNMEVSSNDVNKITNLSKNIQPIIDKGVVFSTLYLQYYYSKLPEARVNLLDNAIKDAKARAEKIAQSSGKKVGVIKSASMGVVQVLPVNSTDISDWGNYDTSTIEKEITVTVKALFTIK